MKLAQVAAISLSLPLLVFVLISLRPNAFGGGSLGRPGLHRPHLQLPHFIKDFASEARGASQEGHSHVGHDDHNHGHGGRHSHATAAGGSSGAASEPAPRAAQQQAPAPLIITGQSDEPSGPPLGEPDTILFPDNTTINIFKHPDNGSPNWWPMIRMGWEYTTFNGLKVALDSLPKPMIYVDLGEHRNFSPGGPRWHTYG
jgi:hypothetical protein